MSNTTADLINPIYLEIILEGFTNSLRELNFTTILKPNDFELFV